MDMSPTNVGYKFRSPTARKLITKFQFVVESKQYSLIAGAIIYDVQFAEPGLFNVADRSRDEKVAHYICYLLRFSD